MGGGTIVESPGQADVPAFRWNWNAGTSETTSQSYDVSKTFYNVSYHCYVLVSATYTFGFGKKIQRGNEASQQMGTSSSILQ